MFLWDLLSPQKEKSFAIVTLSEPSMSVAWERFGTPSGVTTTDIDERYLGASESTAVASPLIQRPADVSGAALQWNRRLVVGSRSHTVEDTCILPAMPVAMSPQGELAFGYGVTVAVTPLTQIMAGTSRGVVSPHVTLPPALVLVVSLTGTECGVRV